MKKIVFYLIMIQLLAVSFAKAQNKPVTGLVTDSSGTGAVAGATVIEKGLPSNGTASDDNGKFHLLLKGKSNTLVINAIGFAAQEIKVAPGQSITVVLKAGGS